MLASVSDTLGRGGNQSSTEISESFLLSKVVRTDPDIDLDKTGVNRFGSNTIGPRLIINIIKYIIKFNNYKNKI